MPNRQLSSAELTKANELLAAIRQQLTALSNSDAELYWAYRRKLYKELSYDERGKPMFRRRLKKVKRAEQGGLCRLCGNPLPEKHVVLDRLDAMGGYTAENTRLIHQDCDTEVQLSRGYA